MKRKLTDNDGAPPPKKKKEFRPLMPKSDAFSQLLKSQKTINKQLSQQSGNKILNAHHSSAAAAALARKENGGNHNGGPMKPKFRPIKVVNEKKFEQALGIKIDQYNSMMQDCLSRVLGVSKPKEVKPLHDPEAPNALVLWTPEEEEEEDDDNENKEEESDSENESDNEKDNENEENKNNNSNKSDAQLAFEAKLKKKQEKQKNKKVKVAIVVDPKLCKVLRAHQRDGVEFVFHCMMGLRHEFGNGCILADGMGLGKTLQAITVMWTLLTQGMYFNEPTCQNGIVIAPASLVKNWDNEIKQWLGETAIATFPCLSNTKKTVMDFIKCPASRKPILIISYESFREHSVRLAYKNGAQMADSATAAKRANKGKKKGSNKPVIKIPSLKSNLNANRRKINLSSKSNDNDNSNENDNSGSSNDKTKTKSSPTLGKNKNNKKDNSVDDDDSDESDKKEYGFIVCDEGHKLKNHESQLSKSVRLLRCSRRLLLSGTPIQNNLDEMYSLVSFVNPNVWSSHSEFRKFARNIERSMDSTASEKYQQLGKDATSTVREILNQFLLQRTSTVVYKYLPRKQEYVVFCKMNSFQETLYEKFLHSKTVLEVKKQVAKNVANAENGGGSGGSGGGGGLNAIGFLACGILCKICNHPTLIYEECAKIAGVKVAEILPKSAATETAAKKKNGNKRNTKSIRTNSEYDSDGRRKRTELEGLFELFPNDYMNNKNYLLAEHSSKCKFVIDLLNSLKCKNDDKVVIVSVYVETLQLLSKILTLHQIKFLRLDGSIPTKQRQKFVDQFNDAQSGIMVLLLSNRAGGCGLNLIGANRLIMYDPDWNPANDQQAMARVWRSGQKKPTYIYRLLSTGSIEEKMFQRQTFKTDMAEQMLAENASDSTEFAVKELKAIFEYNKKTRCDTMDRTKNKGFIGWDRHVTIDQVGDWFLTKCGRSCVSYLLKKIVNDKNNFETKDKKGSGSDDDDDDDDANEGKDEDEDDDDEEQDSDIDVSKMKSKSKSKSNSNSSMSAPKMFGKLGINLKNLRNGNNNSSNNINSKKKKSNGSSNNKFSININKNKNKTKSKSNSKSNSNDSDSDLNSSDMSEHESDVSYGESADDDYNPDKDMKPKTKTKTKTTAKSKSKSQSNSQSSENGNGKDKTKSKSKSKSNSNSVAAKRRTGAKKKTTTKASGKGKNKRKSSQDSDLDDLSMSESNSDDNQDDAYSDYSDDY